MERSTKARFLLWLTESFYKATFANRLTRILYTTLLGLLLTAAMFVVCAPALVAFAIAKGDSAHRELLVNIGLGWLYMLLFAFVAAIVVLFVMAIKRAKNKRRAIKS